MKEVFISYKAEEIEEANWVKSVLEGNGISCWMAPSCIPGGSNYAMEIPNAIRGAKVFVLILSSKAQDSRWVSREVDLAINESKVVLPFMLENCALKDDFNFYLTNVQRYAAYENKVAAAEKMVKEIKAIIGSSQQKADEVTRPEERPEERPEVKQPEEKPEIKEPEKKIDAQKPSENGEKPKKKLDILSIISAAAGILAFSMLINVLVLFDAVLLLLSIAFSLAAMILSVIGAARIKRKAFKGLGFAIAGQVLGAVCCLLMFDLITLMISVASVAAFVAMLVIKKK